ncbi:hypothetical protein GY21_15880 [Cryobacterium roopkundense]|uniref:Polysaccharide pyruvyl transferase WcaK-like protein n=1 Tax=Cryobacterium roopkundense TaxID=1001240 RepID=A0A099J4I4_9MICO|nr:polysaccharide pyruvyl transferase family protein [Cryobacterium roopkundense]KGJ72373.1 hypothetical protein GY21_15880 [Cryobacterium roopkundense]MBB5642381.1 polysaccharide pyruvyl transferase WcaK-like protein [Cryobacterium roopkundense]
MSSLALLDTSLDSTNDGDGIIVNSITALFPELLDLPRVPTHRLPRASELAIAENAAALVLTGTNILSAQLGKYGQWPLDKATISAYEGKIVFLGVGWWQYQNRVSRRARKLLSGLVHPAIEVAARDEYTRVKLESLGIPAVNTNCPTMWKLPERLEPLTGSGECVFTVTDYKPDLAQDTAILGLLSQRYDLVHIWPQGDNDLAYLAKFDLPTNSLVTGRGLPALESALKGRDYVGTRLHAGVRASQLARPSLILAVDNRGIEIGKDSNLRVVPRSSPRAQLEAALSLHASTSAALTLNSAAAQAWSEKFRAVITESLPVRDVTVFN